MKEIEINVKANEPIKTFERTNIPMFKAKNGKSVTLVIKKTDFTDNSDELILNVSIKGLTGFLTDDRFKAFRWNQIRTL